MIDNPGNTSCGSLEPFLSCENNKVISKIKFSFYCFIYIGL